MIFPDHCKYVGIAKLVEDFKPEVFLGRKIYFITRYLVLADNPRNLRDEDTALILKVGVESEGGIMGRVREVEILSPPKTTAVVSNPDVNVMNPNELVPFAWKVAKETGKRGVVVRGSGDHVNFVYFDTPPKIRKLRVIDTKPDGKISELVRLAFKLGLVDTSEIIEVEDVLIDLMEIAEEIDEEVEAIVFPCRMDVPEEINCRKVWFADMDIPFKSIALIGCEISKKIVDERFSGRVVFRNICPMRRAEGVFITKCCKSENTGKRGKGYVVHWSAGMKDIVEALNEILK